MRIATRLPAERKLAREDADQIAEIRSSIIKIGDAWRARHPFIAEHQDHIGLAIFITAIAGVLVDAALFATGRLPWFITIALTAFWLSLLHELEHDLIHSMYFRTNRFVHNLMMFGVWFFRPSTINPWTRRKLHLNHHDVSGTDSDFEERAITNGMGWGPHRLLSLADSFLGMWVKPLRMRKLMRAYVRSKAETREQAHQIIRENALSYFPLGLAHYGLWHLVIGIHIFEAITGRANVPGQGVLDFLAITILAPNALRTFCLHFVSSNMHYFGDVEAHNVMQQTQVWNAKWLFPFHAFCFNFGSTHAIHHFLVRDPFYVREAIKNECHEVLRRSNVRFNDFGTFRRSNRFSLAPVAGSAFAKPTLSGAAGD